MLGTSVAPTTHRCASPRSSRCSTCSAGGRLIVGFPVGTPMDTCYSYGVNPSQLRPKYYEGIELIRKAWTSTEPFAFNGEFNKHRYVNPVPRPYQKPHPPIWIRAAGRWRRDYCAENDFVYGAHLLRGQARPRDRRRILEPRRGARQGLQPEPARGHPVRRCRRHRRRGLPALQGAAEYFFNRSLHVPGFTDPPGYVTEASARSLQEPGAQPRPAPSRPRTT